MLNVNVVCVGNLKEKFSKDTEKEYLKRLSKFCKLNVIELKEQNKLSNITLIKEKEGEEIIKNLSSYNILCDLGGENLSSEEFANRLEKLALTNSKITFVIGGSYGVSEKVKNACQTKISFSKMTFPHNLFRIMLLEQIYRAFTILNGVSYHK